MLELTADTLDGCSISTSSGDRHDMLDVRAQPNVCAENRDDDWWILMGLMHAQVSVLKLETRALNCASFDAL